MFVRVKKNHSVSSSVLVVRKASGRYIVVKNLGVATDEKTIESLRKKGEEWIRLHTDPLLMQFGFDERKEARRVLDNIDFVYHDGAKNDEYNRERGLKKLRKKFASGKLTKDSVNKHGYNRLLVLSGTDNVTVEISDKLISDRLQGRGLLRFGKVLYRVPHSRSQDCL